MGSHRVDYAGPTTPSAVSSASAWVGVAALVGVQTVWYFTWAFQTLDRLDDGSPKQPLRDFVLILGAAVPAVMLLVPCVALAGWQWRRQVPFSRRLPLLIGVLICLLTIGGVGFDWVDQDVLHRINPHGLW